jgi:hypothetical protein
VLGAGRVLRGDRPGACPSDGVRRWSRSGPFDGPCRAWASCPDAGRGPRATESGA